MAMCGVYVCVYVCDSKEQELHLIRTTQYWAQALMGTIY